MTVPIWAVALVAVALVLLVAWAIVSAFAWWGLSLELDEARRDQRLLRIDVYEARTAARRPPTRPFGDRQALAAERDDRVLGSFQP